MSFTVATTVVLASGKTVPISTLKLGQKVLATNTTTGKTEAKPVDAVLVNHDTNRYDLKVRVGHHTAVIHTTANHPVWDATAHRWVKAAALRHGTDLRTPSGAAATLLGGYTPRVRTGWMWELTVRTDHDFYVRAAPRRGAGYRRELRLVDCRLSSGDREFLRALPGVGVQLVTLRK